MAQAQSRRTTPRRSAAGTEDSEKVAKQVEKQSAEEHHKPRQSARTAARTEDTNKIAEQTAKASAEEQQKPRSAAQMKKAEKDFNADERIVQRSSYGEPAGQVTRHDGYQYFDPDAKK